MVIAAALGSKCRQLLSSEKLSENKQKCRAIGVQNALPARARTGVPRGGTRIEKTKKNKKTQISKVVKEGAYVRGLGPFAL